MNSKFIYRIKEFYILETFQVAYYRSQLSALTDEYHIKAFEKIITTEDTHAQFFADMIGKANLELPSLTGTLFDFAGEILGESAESISETNGLKLAVMLEKKAAATYRDFISEAKAFPVIHHALMEYLLDEEFHILWLDNYVHSRAQ